MCSNSDHRQPERRRLVRYHCVGAARIWENGGEIATDGRVNEISLGGCYLETMSPARRGTRLQLELTINRATILLEGIVRLSQPTSGMGVEFTRIAANEAEKLHRIVSGLRGGPSPVQPTGPVRVPAVQLEAASVNRLGQEVLQWFDSRDALTRQEFLDILEQVQAADEQCASAGRKQS